MQTLIQAARRIFKAKGGTLRTGEALRVGIHPRTLYTLRDSGEINQVARGLFRLRGLPPSREPDLVIIAKKVPRAVFCLLTALAFHRLTTHVPHAVAIALPRTARIPRLDHPPLEVFRFSAASLRSGIETRRLDGVTLQIYSREKTLADMFKYRRKLGIDLAVEALRTYRTQPRPDWQRVLEFARVCRVENVMRPYLLAVM